MGRASTLLALAVLLFAESGIAAERDLVRWLDNDAAPFVKQQLLEHPRFKGETVMFVILEGNAPATSSNALALALRDNLLDAAVDTPGVTIGWRQGRSDAHHGTENIDCTRDDVDYYIGLEITQQLDDSYAASLRALDVDERSWVTGFGKSWRGELSMSQRRAVRQIAVDETFLGARDVPFATDQGDLLAQHLAHELSCALLRQTGGDYVVSANHDGSPDELGNTIELVSNNIAANAAIELSNDPGATNAAFSGKAHRINDDLVQYWLTVTPNDTDSELSSLSVSAYLLRPDEGSAAMANRHFDEFDGIPRDYVIPARSTVAMPITHRGSLIGDATFAQDAVVFFVENQLHFGLVRVDDTACRQRARAKLVRAGDTIRFPIAYEDARISESIETDEWFVQPVRDTYYAIAVSNERLARQIANHLDSLPLRCGESARRGLTGHTADRWLQELARLTDSAAEHVDWRAVEIKNVL
jgi:hypothetical protein